VPDRLGADRPLIGTVILGGYLGAGKTTVLNELIATADHRTAVVVNDFGPLGIDQDLIVRSNGRMVTLANGCVCCSVADGLAAALDELDRHEPRAERLVIEASGVADPASVAAYAHRPGFRLDVVAVVVDSERFPELVEDPLIGDSVVGQLGAADLILANKADLIDDSTRHDRATQLRELVGVRPVIFIEHGRVPPAVFEPVAAPPRIVPEPVAALPTGHGLETWSAQWEGPVQRRELEAHLERLSPAVIRVKGIVETDHGWQAVHRVGRRITFSPCDPVASSRLVAIGHHGALTAEQLALVGP